LKDSSLYQRSDEDLIKEFQENNTVQAFEILVSRYKNNLFNYVFRFLNDYEATSDVVQETMIKVYRNKDSYKSIAKFSTWIYTIAGNLAKTELARVKRKNLVSIHSHSEEEEGIDLTSTDALPDMIVDSGIKEEMIQEALMKVNEAYREMVILRDIQELSYEEIAEITGITVGTVKSRINRGRAQLKALLKGIYKE